MTDIVERLRDFECNHDPFSPEHKHCQCLIAEKAAAEIERLRALLKEREWMPIESAPDDDPFNCLVCMTIGPHPNHRTIIDGFRYRGIWTANATPNCGHRITHWQPLLPPPSEDKS